MSLRENIQFFHQLDPDEYLKVLREEFSAHEHPSQSGAFMVDELPFYEPRQIEDHISILSFNYAPLSDLLIEALINNPELAPDTTIVHWLQEQDVIMEATLGELRKKFGIKIEG